MIIEQSGADTSPDPEELSFDVTSITESPQPNFRLYESWLLVAQMLSFGTSSDHRGIGILAVVTLGSLAAADTSKHVDPPSNE